MKTDTIALRVNGTRHELRGVDPTTPLLWVLRDALEELKTLRGDIVRINAGTGAGAGDTKVRVWIDEGN